MTANRIQIMISSRCDDLIRKAGGRGSVKLTELRKRAKEAIEGTKLFDRDTFECWIHEDQPALPGDGDAWDNCLAEAKRCHILLMLYNGSAGFGRESENVGICQAEVMTALNTGPGKLRVIDLTRANVGRPSGDAARNKRFADYMKEQDLAVRFATDNEEALALILEAVQDAVVYLTDRGAGALRTGRYATGSPLDWSRLDYARRKQAIEQVVIKALGDESQSADGGAVHEIDNARVYFHCHAIPAAMSVAAAREMVGRPFLRDHETLASLKGDVVGPVHIIGCHKSVTENQAVNLLGFPDATIVTPEFGVYVADNVQKIQLVFLANCRDDATTRLAVQQFQAWLRRSGEAPYMAQRARGRKAIVSAIAKQLSQPRPGR
jgi:hypothetical protein